MDKIPVCIAAEFHELCHSFSWSSLEHFMIISPRYISSTSYKDYSKNFIHFMAWRLAHIAHMLWIVFRKTEGPQVAINSDRLVEDWIDIVVVIDAWRPHFDSVLSSLSISDTIISFFSVCPPVLSNLLLRGSYFFQFDCQMKLLFFLLNKVFSLMKHVIQL